MTAWLLTWLWQGTALAALMAMLLQCAPRLNATTRHVIWCGVFLALIWLGLAASPNLNWGLTPVPVGGADSVGTALAQPVLYVPSPPDFLIAVGLGVWAAMTLVNMVRLIAALHAMYAVRDRCRPFPASLEARLPLWREAKGRGRRSQLVTCDAID